MTAKLQRYLKNGEVKEEWEEERRREGDTTQDEIKEYGGVGAETGNEKGEVEIEREKLTYLILSTASSSYQLKNLKSELQR